ncbi:putative gustatory receptor 59f [Haematobia irritans]|uniref:putative gustatory receptor 59f n=1 Tax=Haematobia irritans TaxID=7368 RepID=UPI003F4FDA16
MKNDGVKCFKAAAAKKREALEKQFYGAIYHLMVLSQIFLCAPTAVHRPKVIEKKAEKLLYYLHLIWSVSLYVGLVACIYDEYTSSNTDLPTIQKPLYFSEYMVYLIHLLEILLRIHWGREKFWVFYRFLLDFNLKLMEMKLRPKYNRLRRFIHLHLLLNVVHFTCTLIVGYYYSTGIWWNFFRTSTVYILPNVVIQISLVHYYALLYVIAECLQRLNGLLDQLLLSHKILNSSTFRIQVHLMRSLYGRVEQFTRDVNDVFSYSIILVYFGSFINITLNIFLLYKFLSDWQNSAWAWIFYSAIWTCMHIGKMFLILYYNEKIQRKVRHFILQLMSDTRSNVICGLAALNLNFVTSLLMAISTLFIFVVQYDITFDALHKVYNSTKTNSN